MNVEEKTKKRTVGSTSSDAPIGAVVPEDEQVDAGSPNTLEIAPGMIIDLNDSLFEEFCENVTRQIFETTWY